MTTISQVVDAFTLFFDAVHRPDFRKSMSFHKYSERALQPLVRSMLLGWFGHVSPEVRSKLAGSLTGFGSIDFVIGNVAVEFAVRRPMSSRAALSDVTNATEIKKLMQYEGKSLLVLYDFSRDPYTSEDLDRYREWRSLDDDSELDGHSFNLAYFYRERFERKLVTACIRKNIRF